MNRRRAAIIAAILLLLAAVVAFALTRPGEVEVPNLIEKDRASALELLSARGLEAEVLPRPACADPGTVVEQNPGGGEDVDEGSAVTLTVSTGERVEVPRVAGLRANKAAEKLQDSQLNPVDRQRDSGSVKPGDAIGTRPRAGSEVPCESRVDLLVSRGEALVRLPSVVGKQRTEAEARLERLGFVVDEDFRDADEPEGEVIGQDPGPGSQLPEGRTVTIIVSTGAGSVIVPGVVGQSEESARANLTGRGLGVSVEEESTDDPSEDGRVLDQAPEAGTRVLAGEQVTIVVGSFEEPEPEPEPEPPPEEEPPPPEPEPPPKGTRR